MIIALRKSLKGKTFKIIFWVVILATSGILSVFEFIRSSYFGKNSSSWILRINKTTIYAPQFMRAVADQEERIRIMRAQYGQYADLYFQMMGLKVDPQQFAINDIVRKALLNQVTQKLPFSTSEDAARSQLNNPALITQEISDLVPFFTWDPSINGINIPILYTYLQRVGVSQSEFIHELMLAVQRDDVKKLVELSSYVPTFELKELFSQNYLGHKFSIMTISLSDLVNQAKKQTVTDEKLKEYFDLANAQKNQYRTSEKRSVKIVTFEPSTYGISVSDDEIQKYYNNNKAQFLEQPAQVQVRHILLEVNNNESEIQKKAEELRQELIKNPASFAQKAQEFSDDKATKTQGGLLPYFTKGQHEKVFEKAAFLLKENGDIAAVIRTTKGFEIIQRAGKKNQTFKSLPQVTQEIKDILTKKKFAEQFSGQARTAINQSDMAINSFVEQKHGRETTAKDILSDNSLLAKTAFKLKKGETSYYQDKNQGVLVTTTDIKESSIPSLKDIKDKVANDYYQDEGKRALSELLETIKKNDQPLESYKQFGSIEKTGWLYKNSDKKADEAEKKRLQSQGLDINRMFQIENKGSVNTYIQQDKGYVIRLDDIANFDQTLFEEKKEQLLTEQKQQKKSLVTAGFVASLYRNAKIKKNESQLTSVA